jgi:hypothetical protein
MRSIIILLTLVVSLHVYGQQIMFYKTTGKRNLHYIAFGGDRVTVYKMGKYLDKAGSGPAILLSDTLLNKASNEFNGRVYSLLKTNDNYILLAGRKTLKTEPEDDINKVITELNNAYYLKSFWELSKRLNKEFVLYHYTFRNGYYAWEKQANKSIPHNKFIEQTDKEIQTIYDSISAKQTALTRTTNFITENAGQVAYSVLKDSISTLPIDYTPNSGYFDKSVYHIAKSNPDYFYKLLADFPASKTHIYFAVGHDEALVKQIRQVQGYDELKKEFLKDYKFGKTLPYRVIGAYAVVGGLLTWLIVSQK